MADLPVSNAEMVAEMIIGADVTETVTPANPSPPTNITSDGETPPTTIAAPVEAPDDHDDWGSPLDFAANAGGVPHEGFNQTSSHEMGLNVVAVTNDLFPWTTTPNIHHPSHPDYVEDTTMGLSERGVDTSGEDEVYADEDFEDEEEEAAKAAREARGEPAPKRRGRPPGAKNRKGQHK